MLKHDFFDLLVHSTDELDGLLGEHVVERQAVHAWPFSVVERLTTASGTRWIYKTQHVPTLEPDFYERVRSPLLPSYRLLKRDPVYATMLFEFVDAPLIRELALSEQALVEHAQAVVEAIGKIEAEVPVYIDIGTVVRWQEFVASTLGRLAELVGDKRLQLTVAPEAVDTVTQWSQSASVCRLIEETSRLTHGDLNPGNVFVTRDGYRVIDWQRPQIAPAQVDFAALLEGTPYLFPHTPPDVIGVFYFLRLFWAVHAKANLLPGLPHLFDRWASEAIDAIQRAAELSHR